MSRSRVISLLAVFVFLCAAVNAFAEDRAGGYVLVKPGAFIPTGDLEHAGFDNSFSGEVVIGTYYSRHLALEAGVGYYQTEASVSGAGFTEEDELSVIPVTVTFKGVLPFRGGELNAGIGPGVYFAGIEAKGSNIQTGSFSNDAHSAVLGGHVLIGGNIDITKNLFIGAEGKYIFTTGAHLLGSKITLDGFMVSGVLGYRL